MGPPLHVPGATTTTTPECPTQPVCGGWNSKVSKRDVIGWLGSTSATMVPGSVVM